jgi:hypothetical protein
MSRPSKQTLLFLLVYWNLCNATSEFSNIQWHLTNIYGPKVFLLTKKNPEYSRHPVQSDTFPWSLGVSDWTGFTVLNKMNCELMLTYDTPAYMFNVYKNQPSRQTGSRNLMGPKTLTTIWGTYMKHVTKYQIPVINSCWEKCDEKCAYMLNVYKNQLSRQTGSRNLTGPKTLSTIWHTYMKVVTKYQISAIDSCWDKCDEKYLGRTDRGKTVYPPLPPGSGGIIS